MTDCVLVDFLIRLSDKKRGPFPIEKLVKRRLADLRNDGIFTIVDEETMKHQFQRICYEALTNKSMEFGNRIAILKITGTPVDEEFKTRIPETWKVKIDNNKIIEAEESKEIRAARIQPLRDQNLSSNGHAVSFISSSISSAAIQNENSTSNESPLARIVRNATIQPEKNNKSSALSTLRSTNSKSYHSVKNVSRERVSSVAEKLARKHQLSDEDSSDSKTSNSKRAKHHQDSTSLQGQSFVRKAIESPTERMRPASAESTSKTSRTVKKPSRAQDTGRAPDDSVVPKTIPDDSSQGAFPNCFQYTINVIISEVVKVIQVFNSPEFEKLHEFCQDILLRPEISSKNVFLSQVIMGMRLCLRMIRKKSFAENEEGGLVESRIVLENLIDMGRRVSSTETERPEELADLILQMKRVRIICKRDHLKIPIKILETSFWIFVRLVVIDTLTNSGALQRLRILAALGDSMEYKDSKNFEELETHKMLRILVEGALHVQEESSDELVEILQAAVNASLIKKTFCVDVVEAVEECLCLVLHNSSEQLGSVDTSKLLQILLNILSSMSSDDVLLKEKIDRLFNIAIVAVEKCKEFKIRRATAIQILKVLILNATDSKIDLPRYELPEPV